MQLCKYLFAALFFSVLLSSCKKDEAGHGNLTLKVNAKYGDQAFALNSPNTDPNGRRIQVEKLKFYLSHIILVKTDNSEVELKDVLFLDMANTGSLICDLGNVTGDFKAIKFSSGVDSLQNETDPLSAPSGSPLSGDNGMYWSWLKYQFVMFESRADTTTTGSGNFNWYPVYHIGGNNYYRTTQLAKDFSVCCGNQLTLNLTLDIKKIFFGNENLDIISERSTQSSGSDDPAIAPKFMNNFSTAFSID